MARSKHIPDDLTTLPSSAAEARAVGAKYYYTGRPCRRGHFAARQTGNETCQACANEAAKARPRGGGETPEERLARARKSDVRRLAKDGHAIAERLQRIEDVGLEAVLAEEAEVAEQLAEARCADSRARRLKKMEEEGTEVVREHERRLGRRTYRRNAEAQRERARDRRRAGDAGYAALRNRTPPWLTPEELEEMDSIYESRVREGTNPEEVDHVFPIKAHPTLTGTHVPWNLQVLTRTLNNQRQQTRRNGFTCTDDEAELYIACGMAIRRADMAPGGQVDWSRYPRPSDELIEAARRQISASSG